MTRIGSRDNVLERRLWITESSHSPPLSSVMNGLRERSLEPSGDAQRRAAPNGNVVHRFGPFSLSIRECSVFWNGLRLPIRPKAFDILCELIKQNKCLVTRDSLINTIWPDVSIQEENLTESIYELRKALNVQPGWGSVIETLPRRGYRFNADVHSQPADAHGAPTQVPCTHYQSDLTEKWYRAGEPMTDNVRRLCAYARLLINNRNTTAIYTALELCNQGIRTYPHSAQVWAAWADCYSLLGCSQVAAMSPHQAAPVALLGVRNALRISPDLAEAHATLGFILWRYRRKWHDAEHRFRKAVALKPAYVPARLWYSECLAGLGRLSEAADQMRMCRLLDPSDDGIRIAEGWLAYMSRRYKSAVKQLTDVTESNPSRCEAHTALGLAYIATKDYGRAKAELRRAQMIDETCISIGLTGLSAGLFGDHEEAANLLQHLRDQANVRYVCPVSMALINIGLNNMDEAIIWMGRAVKAGDPYLVYVKADPVFDLVRCDSRFQRFVDRVIVKRL